MSTCAKRFISPREYAAIISMILASIYLLLLSFFPLVYNFTTSFDPVDFLKNFLLFTIGTGNLAGVSYLIRKDTYLQHIADETFEKVIYQRLEPVLRDVAEVQVGINDMKDEMEMINLNLRTLTAKKKPPETSVSGIAAINTKYIVLINITLAVFLFMLQYPFDYIPYMVTLLFMIWWLVITLQYGFWKYEIAWTWIFFPVLTLPISTIILNSYLDDYQLFGILSLGLCIYILSYYSWCSFKVKGVLPFDLQDIIHPIEIDNKKRKDDSSEDKRPIVQNQNLNLANIFFMNRIAPNLILVSIAMFGVTWLGYSIQHNLIPNISWETIGLKDFEWSSTYTYAANIIGIILIITGIKLQKPIKS